MMHSGKFLVALKKPTDAKVICMHRVPKDPHCASAEKEKAYGQSKVPNGELGDKTTERNFKTIANYMEIPRLLLAPMFLLLPVIRDIYDPSSQYLVSPRDPPAKKGGL